MTEKFRLVYRRGNYYLVCDIFDFVIVCQYEIRQHHLVAWRQIVDDLLIAAHQLAASHKEYADNAVESVGRYRKDVQIKVLRQSGDLSAHKLVKHLQLPAIEYRKFKVLPLRRRSHFFFEKRSHLLIVSRQKRNHALNLLGIRLFAAMSVARSQTPVDMIIETWSVTLWQSR